MSWEKFFPGNGRLPALAIALFVFMGISCAKQGIPPGGPVDSISPELISSSPAANATNVPVSGPILFEFSEVMDEKSVEENLYIVPIPSQWPDFEWQSRGRKLALRLNQPLNGNTTYVISIGTKAQDLRRNGLENSVMLCFSTGNVVENKRITGKVIPFHYFDEKPETVSGIDVIAYRLADGAADPDPRNDVPDYFTQTGSDGSYEIIGLSRGTFRLFAVGDKDKDGFFTEGYDMIGVTPHDLMLAEGDSVISAPDVMVSLRQVSEVQFTSVRVPDNRRIELFFDRAVEPETIQLQIDELEVTGWFHDRENPRLLSVATGEQEARRKYIISGITAGDSDGNSLMTFESPPFFTGTDRPDTTALQITSWTPNPVSSPDEPMLYVFNRILDYPKGIEGIIEQDAGDNLSVKKVAPNEIEITPVESWQMGSDYIILLDRESLRGVAGNRLTESGARLEFRIPPSDTLGTIEGTIEDFTENPSTPYRLIFREITTGSLEEIEVVEAGTWSTEPILPGKYLCLAHKDSDGNGAIFRGTVYPYHTAEQVVAYPDTITVESRWPTENIDFIFK